MWANENRFNFDVFMLEEKKVATTHEKTLDSSERRIKSQSAHWAENAEFSYFAFDDPTTTVC